MQRFATCLVFLLLLPLPAAADVTPPDPGLDLSFTPGLTEIGVVCCCAISLLLLAGGGIALMLRKKKPKE
ncbi:MAG: hypothetical protein AB8I08_19510 [Sandaracinaceae bacterium]